jgi:predicted nucleic acid-binding Zn finger protein
VVVEPWQFLTVEFGSNSEIMVIAGFCSCPRATQTIGSNIWLISGIQYWLKQIMSRIHGFDMILKR